jgi:Flp pilus assembly protein TadD
MQALWPANMGVLYPAAPPGSGDTGLAVLILLAVTALVLVFARVRPYLFTGWFWYVGMLVPVIGIVQVGVQSRADRYVYVPLVGLTIMIVWAAADWLELHPVLQRPAALAAGAVLLVFALGTWHQAGYWKDSRTLFEHTLAVTERNYVIQNNQGVIMAREGDLKGAINQHRQALAVYPEYADAHANLGDELQRAGQYDASRPELLEALRLNPASAMVLADLGLLDAAAGNYPDAISHLNEALRLAPDMVEPHNNLCFALQHSGRVDEAIVQCREALRLKPDYPDAERNLKSALDTR